MKSVPGFIGSVGRGLAVLRNCLHRCLQVGAVSGAAVRRRELGSRLVCFNRSQN